MGRSLEFLLECARLERGEKRKTIDYRKIPKTNPCKYKLLKLVTQKNPPNNSPRGLILGNCPQKAKTVQ